MRKEVMGGKREREDPTSKGSVECRIISGLHTFRVSSHYTHEAHSSLPLFFLLPAPKYSRVQRYTRRCPKRFPRDIKGEP